MAGTPRRASQAAQWHLTDGQMQKGALVRMRAAGGRRLVCGVAGRAECCGRWCWQLCGRLPSRTSLATRARARGWTRTHGTSTRQWAGRRLQVSLNPPTCMRPLPPPPLPPWKPGFGTWRVVVVPVKRMPPTPGPRGGGPWVPVSRHTRYRNHSRRHTATCRPGGQQTERRGRMQCSRCLLRRTPCGLLLADGGPGQLAAAGGLFRGQPP